MQSTHKIKNEGKIFTPAYLVSDMLDFAGYRGYSIMNKHIMENSCGDGAFLAEIVRRYCEVFPYESLKSKLETFIHGIEKDYTEYKKCIARLDFVAAEFGIQNVEWDIVCGDALELYKNYLDKMDFVIGNPPYIRVHNLTTDIRNFAFATDGMTDEYLVFYEIGLKMLSPAGKMCLITPSSFLRSKAGQNFRNYIFQNKNLCGIIDLEHFQPFNATTYTAVTLFDNTDSESRRRFSYYRYIGQNQIEFVDNLDYAQAFINKKLYLASKQVLQALQDIEIESQYEKSVSVKNGFATLADDIFIGDFDFAQNTIGIIKSSTGKWGKCIFPYRKDGSPLPEFAVRNNAPLWKYLSENRKRLENRSIADKKDWYLFGRTQALRDVSRDKIAINQLIKDTNSLKINFVPAGSGVYGGLYIISEFCIEEIESVLKTTEFVDYIKSLKNYKSGGYYTFSSADLEKFLNYKLTERKQNALKLVANY
ncbi:MAG: SAM-dependent methyltransferase [Rickettsiales bacterium]|nr:SAM-dependent methyltransferase [Rickettsiales bacterium]